MKRNSICEQLDQMANPNAEELELQRTNGSKSQRSLSLLHASLEVDPNKANETDDVVENQIQLQLFVHRLWKTVIDSEPDVPEDFRQLFAVIASEMPKMYPDKSAIYKAIGSFFFLRFICPSLATPHVYGLTATPPTDQFQRMLVLLSKVLQNIANGTLPGKKEAYMESMNSFIESHIKQGTEFFERLAKAATLMPGERIDVERYEVPQNLYDTALLDILKHLRANAVKLKAAFDEARDQSEMKFDLNILMR